MAQLPEIPDLEVEFHLGEIGRDADHGQDGNVDVRQTDGLRDGRKRTGLVDRGDDDAGLEARLVGLVEIPADIDPALGLLVEFRERRRLDRIDGDRLLADMDADDAVARHCAGRRETDLDVATETTERMRLRDLLPGGLGLGFEA